MPLDTKRINGPEISTPYRIYCKASAPKAFEERLSEAIGKDGTRKDGRLLLDSRKYYTKIGVVSTAKGSAYVELGNTKVIVSVFDPREIPKQNKFNQLGELYCDFKYSPFASVVRKAPQTDARERSMATALTSALNPSVCRHLFPNLQIDVFVNVLEDDGSALAVAITAAGLALGDACIPMFDIVTAATAGILGNRILVDPTAEEEALCMDGYTEDNHGLVMIAKLPTLDQVSEIRQYGNVDVEMLWQTCKQLNTNCGDLVPIVQHVLVTKVKTHLRELEIESDNESEPGEDKEDTADTALPISSAADK
ncbi:exosome complex component MTR3-like [Anopheles marshallii]|uniref:exosome complex component MTR3-like n=1 Tax=Anopheles marshallii TaxID=1521116 RepID=UPI00237C07A5|nr:exosome complex component MTR3-like [Anopheles marshallii]